MNVLILGAGIFGVTAALELHNRGHRVQLLDAGPVPHPLAASTDITKAIRMDYGPDDEYLEAMELAMPRWREWNRRYGQTLFHETGLLYLARTTMQPGTFEYESFLRLQQRGHAVERMNSSLLSQRFPAWNAAHYPDGYFNPVGGWAASGATVSCLWQEARRRNIQVHEGFSFEQLLTNANTVEGVQLRDGRKLYAERVVAALGAWTPHAFPWLQQALRSVGMPVFHLRPDDPTLFAPERFPTFGAALQATGWYGFPLHESGVVKVAHHGPGRAMHPESPARTVTEEELAALRVFLQHTFPALSNAPVVATRVCLYSDTHDGHLWIDEDPAHKGLIVASGDSGHAFKFAPLLGEWIANVVEEKHDSWRNRFRWRAEQRNVVHEEAARFLPEKTTLPAQ